MGRVIARFATQNHRAGETGIAKLAVRTFASRHGHETRRFQSGNQLSDFTVSYWIFHCKAQLGKLNCRLQNFRPGGCRRWQN